MQVATELQKCTFPLNDKKSDTSKDTWDYDMYDLSDYNIPNSNSQKLM